MPSNLSTIHLDIVENNIPIIYLKIDKKYSYLKVNKEEGKDQEWIPSRSTPDPGHNSQHIISGTNWTIKMSLPEYRAGIEMGTPATDSCNLGRNVIQPKYVG